MLPTPKSEEELRRNRKDLWEKFQDLSGGIKILLFVPVVALLIWYSVQALWSRQLIPPATPVPEPTTEAVNAAKQQATKKKQEATQEFLNQTSEGKQPVPRDAGKIAESLDTESETP